MSEVKMPAELAQSIANYLSTKPFREVAGLLQDMQTKAIPIEPKKPENEAA